MAKIHFFQAGYCTHPACVAVRGAGLGACEFPARVFLLEANGRFWLWDTGYAEHFFDASRGVYALYAKVTPVFFNPSEHICRQLAKFGLSVADLAGVIISHFHADHIAGLKDFANIPLNWQTACLRFFKAIKRHFSPKTRFFARFDANRCRKPICCRRAIFTQSLTTKPMP